MKLRQKTKSTLLPMNQLPRSPRRGAMAKRTSAEYVLVSCRLPPDLYAWAKSEADGRAWALNELVRRVLDDTRTLYGLPKEITDTLNADRKSMGLNWREYSMQILTLRYKQLASQGRSSSGR